MEAYPHLRIEREQPVKEKRSGRYVPPPPPGDTRAHGLRLKHSFQDAQEINRLSIGGFDERALFKLNVGALPPEEIEKGLPGVEVIAQEDGGYALVFASAEALAGFERRLSQLIDGKSPTYKHVLYAMQSVDNWTPDDRKGWALKLYGLPDSDFVVLDIELWPLGRSDERKRLVASFQAWLKAQRAEVLDRIDHDDLLAYRLKLPRAASEEVLKHRDVRTVDLPPRIGLELNVLQTDIQEIPAVPAPAANAPLIAVLDSGIAAGHPLLAPAIGDAQGFLAPDRDASDANGHGTLVAGIALYDDVEDCARSKSFVPQLRLLSGRILDHNAESDPRFIENIVEEAVRYFHGEYGCKVFNLSYGDLNKPYRGGRVRGLAYTLDRISRELQVLFVVPTGNLATIPIAPEDGTYPDYLFEDSGRLLDPAPALNVLTVGSLARWDRAVKAWRNPNDLTDVPLAQHDFPSPFTRCGGSVRGAVKPDLVAYGGNIAVDPRTGNLEDRWLGELSTSKDFANGRLLAEKIGTSFAAPHVAHMAARILAELPNATPDLLRALLVANANIPSATTALVQDEDKRACVVGYGMVDTTHLYRSTEENVILVSDALLTDKHSHFYEVPLPPSFYAGGRRQRLVSIALAHCPPVKTTRLDYKATRLQFRLVEAASLDDAVAAFDKATAGEVEGIKEFLYKNRSTYGASKRGYGTVQASTWFIKQPRKAKLFVVVTRNDQLWGKDMTLEDEPYALVIRLGDRENAQARLYTEIRTQLQIRGRARV